MAYYELEPFGDLIADQRHGVAAALLANLNRSDQSRSEPFVAEDFIHWRATGKDEDEEEPELLVDPVAHSNLIRAVIFGLQPRE
jgi:hypothetical protein